LAKGAAGQLDMRAISGGMLVQSSDTTTSAASAGKVVSARKPTAQELADLDFGWRVAKHVKSNAIVFVGGGRTLGVGAGQMSRVDSVKLAVSKARSPLAGSVLASDAFFPSATAWTRQPRQGSRPSSSPADPCATPRSLPRPTSTRLHSSLPASVTSDTNHIACSIQFGEVRKEAADDHLHSTVKGLPVQAGVESP